MKKGFSLVELLAVVVILGLIVLISIPIVSSSINKAKEEARDIQIQEIIKAAKKYAIKNSYILPTIEGNTKKLDIQNLIDENYIDADEIIDPVTEKTITGCINICYKCSEVEYEYEYDISCES